MRTFSTKIMILFFLATGTAEGHPEASFYIQEWALVRSNNDSIYSGTYNVPLKYDAIIGNTDDDSDTVLSNISCTLSVDNITHITEEKHARVNDSFVQWSFPEEKVNESQNIDVGIDTDNYKSINARMDMNRWTNQSLFYSNGDVFQLAKFNVTFHEPGDMWGQIETWGIPEKSNVTAIPLPETFSTDAPITTWGNWDKGVAFNFDHNTALNKTYNLSVVIKLTNNNVSVSSFEYKPALRIAYTSGKDRIGETSFTASMPPDMLPDNFYYAYASTNISNQWSYYYTYFKGMYITRTFNTSITPLPSIILLPCIDCRLPTDPDNDSLYEDINGNGRKDFNDVVIFFENLEWVAANEPAASFDFNSNGRIDFADVVKLFEEL